MPFRRQFVVVSQEVSQAQGLARSSQLRSPVRSRCVLSVGFSRLPICHQLELVVGESEAAMSRLQPTWGLVFRLQHSEH